MCQQRLAQLLRGNSEAVLWATSAALESGRLNKYRRYELQRCCAESPATTYRPELLTDAAAAIGRRLCNLGFHTDRGATWLTMKNTAAGSWWQVLPVDGSLYDGLDGILLAFDILSYYLGDQRLARRRDNLLEYFEGAEGVKDRVGGYDGLGGELLVKLALRRHYSAEELSGSLQRTIDAIRYQETVEIVDVLAGGAGAVLALCETARGVFRQ